MTVRRVLHVAKTHLDVGFTDRASAVRRRYLDDFVPRAMRTAVELREEGGPARLRWTTGSWILTEALDAAAPAERRRIEGAIEAGDLVWHALPFTMHTEYADRSLLEHAMSISAALDERFGRRTRAAKMTDVPGHTRGLVPVLAAAGVELLHIGVNPAAAAPDVPPLFRWRTGEDSVLVMYDPDGYGDVSVLPGTDVAVSIDVTGDNLGPRDAAAATARFADLAGQFPGAEVVAATLDDVADALAEVDVPVLDAEIGDSWIHGTGTAPVMTAGFRALSRLRRTLPDDSSISAGSIRAASTQLLLVAEHTWGLDLKTHWPDTTHWSAAELASVRDDPAVVALEASWADQDRYLDAAAELLGSEAVAALSATRAPVAPYADRVTGLAEVAATTCSLGPYSLELDPVDGAVVGGDLASAEVPLGRFRIDSFDAVDYARWFATYNAATRPEDLDWARWDNTKPGLEHSGAVSRTWSPRLVSVHAGRRDDAEVVVIALDPPEDLGPGSPVAWPGELTVELRVRDGAPDVVELELAWSDKPAARWPESSWWSVAPAVASGAASQWRMRKLGVAVSPGDVVAGGGRHLHVVERLDHPGATVELLDSGLVAPGLPRPLRWDDAPVDRSGAWWLCAHANLWGTNFAMWAPGDARFRTRIRVRAG